MDIIEYGEPITLETAKQVIDKALTEALLNNWAVTIAIFDSTGHLVALNKMNHAQLSSVEIAQVKARTSVNFKRATKFYDEAVAADGPGLRILSVGDICPFEGGIPLLNKGNIIGAIGVSGAKPDQDGIVAIAGANFLKGYLESENV